MRGGISVNGGCYVPELLVGEILRVGILYIVRIALVR